MSEEPETTGGNRNEKGQFKPGVSGNPKGRPEGSISVIHELKKIFQENPEDFEEFVLRYKKNPQNEKHIAEMIDGKPSQGIDLTTKGKELPTPIIPLNVQRNNSDTEDNQPGQED